MPKTTDEPSNQHKQGGQGDPKAASKPEPTKPGQEKSGFQDPLPPGTDSKSGPGSDGPV